MIRNKETQQRFNVATPKTSRKASSTSALPWVGVSGEDVFFFYLEAASFSSIRAINNTRLRVPDLLCLTLASVGA